LEIWARNAVLKEKGSPDYNPRLTESELKAQCLVIQIADIALRPTISSKQIALLRELIAALQEYAYKKRPGFLKCVNMHWLVHLPDDIERYGPVYSWWLFGYERMNKTLKGANSNGHFRDTPLIAFNKFLRLGSLGILGSHDAPKNDLASQLLAESSERAFQHAMSNANAIDEERDAQNWQQERLQSGQNFHRSRPSIISVDKDQVAPVEAKDLGEIARLWNARPGAQVAITQTHCSQSSNIGLLPRHATYITRFRIGKYNFEPLCLNRRGPRLLDWNISRSTRAAS
jgi:hypothetical protein